jgi:single-strand DNA-binding protein
MVNRVILAGNLTRDAESHAGSRGPITRMRLATSHHWRDADGNRQETSEFHNLVAFGRLAEICGLYCLKGRRIYAEGRLRTREYDGNDGLRRASTEVVLDVMRLLDRREDAGSGTDLHGPETELLAVSPAEEEQPDESRLALSGAGAH